MIPGTDTRLCVDCRAGDNSSVFHREMLDDPDEFGTEATPWCFDHDHGPTEFFATEDEARAAQRAYRTQRGFDPITGLQPARLRNSGLHL